MTFKSWLKSIQAIVGRKPSAELHRACKRKAARVRLRLEELEDRLVPSVNTSTLLGASVGNTSVAAVVYGTAVTFAATISPASGSAFPTAGSVDFQDGSTDLGVISTETVSGSNAVFTLVTTAKQLQVIQANSGVHTITATYSPGGGFNGSTESLPGGLTVTPALLTITGSLVNDKVYDGTTSATINAGLSGFSAAGLTPGDFLVTDIISGPTGIVREYTPAGVQVKDIDLPYPDVMQDGIALDANGNIESLGGDDFHLGPYVSLYTVNPVTGNVLATTQIPYNDTGYNANLTHGGIATYGNYVFAANTDYSGQTTGIIAFNINNYSTRLFANGTDYIQATMGQNGYLYALTEQGNIDLFDPGTLALVQHITPAVSGLTAIAVDRQGNIYGTIKPASNNNDLDTDDTRIYALNSSGAYVNSVSAGIYGAFGIPDIYINQQEQLFVIPNYGSPTQGEFLQTNTSLSTLTTIPIGQTSSDSFICQVEQPQSGPTLQGVLSGDSVTLDTSAATAHFNSPDAGQGVGAAVSGLRLSGTQAGNYMLAQTPRTTTATIAPKTILVSGITANNKVYDATVNVSFNTVNAVLAGVLSTDHVTLSSVSGSFPGKDVGAAIPISGIALNFGGAQASDYIGVLNENVPTATISPAPLTGTVTGVYGGSTVITLGNLMAAITGGLYSGDNVVINPNGLAATFASRDVGTNIPVTVPGLTLSGSQATDYNLTTLTGMIIPSQLFVTGLTVNTKVYDGTKAATLNFSKVALAGTIYGNDSVSLDTTHATAMFSGGGVVNGQSVNCSGLALAGAQAGDYQLANVGSLTGNITPAPLLVSGITADNKVYNGTSTATLEVGGAILSGLIGSDTAVLSKASGQFASKFVNNNDAVTISSLTLGGSQGFDYMPVLNQAAPTAKITPAPLSLSGITVNNKVFDGTTSATLNTSGAVFVGLIGSDNVTLVTTGATANFASPNIANNVPVAVAGLTIAGLQGADYMLVQPTLTGNITLVPGSVSDGGTARLTFALGTNQSLAIVSNGSSYTFTSNQILAAASSTDPTNQSAAFSGLGTTTLTLTAAGISQYGLGINIVDAGANASVSFNNSGTNTYANNFNVNLGFTGAGGISFNGNSNFGNFNLQASTTFSILANTGASVVSSNGNITLLANQQSLPTSGNFAGVTVKGATVKSTANGSVVIQGRGGNTGATDYGIYVETGGSIIGGNGANAILLTGTGGATASGSAYGVYVAGTNSLISSTGGNVQVTGTGGGLGSSANNDGVYIEAGGLVTAAAGASVSVSGTGGATTGSNNSGIYLNGSGTLTSNNADLQLTGTGGGLPGSSSNFNSGVNDNGSLSATGNGNIMILGTEVVGGGGGGFTTTSVVTTANGNLQINGVGGISFLPETGLPSTIGGKGNVVLTGTPGPTGSGMVEIDGSPIVTTNGNIQITGTSTTGIGVAISLTANSVQAGGTGSIIIAGSGKNANVSGVEISANLATSHGNIQISGVGTLNGSAAVSLGGQITAGGTGNIVVSGTGGNASAGGVAGTYGVEISGALNATGGNVQITGTAFAGGLGIFVISNQFVTGSISAPAKNASITLVSDSINVVATAPANLVASQGTVILMPQTSGTSITLGAFAIPNNATGSLEFNDQEFHQITAATVQFGSSAGGSISVIAPCEFLTPTNLSLISGGSIFFNTVTAGPLSTDGGSFTLTTGANGSVQPMIIGNEVITTPGAVAFGPGSNLGIAINGPAADIQYGQLGVLGNVNLTGSNLHLSGTFTPSVGETFTVVDNEGSQPITGTFNGLPEGGVIINLLGSGLDAKISYVGGNGNDAVLTVINPIATTAIVTASASSVIYGTPVTFTASIAAVFGNIAPTAGSVDFQDGSTDLGAVSLANNSGNDGVFTLVTTPSELQVIQSNGGIHKITALYTPGSGFIGSTGTLAASLKVTPAPLTITAVTNTKTYDSTTTAVAIPTVSGLIGSDSVVGSEVYSDRNVGFNKTLSVSAYTINDSNGGNNYTLTTLTNTNGAITKKAVTVIGIIADNKIYDATTSATLNTINAALIGLIGTDNVGLTMNNAMGALITKNAGNNVEVDVSGLMLGGPQALDYLLTEPTTTAKIAPAPLTLTAITNTKNYDGTTSAAAVPTASALVGNDSVTGLAEAYSDKNVGAGKTLSVSAYSINDGNGGNNYAVTTVSDTTGAINKGVLLIKATTNTKSWDGATSAVAIPTVSGLASGDTITGLTEVYSDTNVATGKTLSVNPGFIINDGNSGKNYTVTTAIDKTGVINPPNTILTLPNSLTEIEPPQGLTYTVNLTLTVNVPLNYTVNYQTVNGSALAGTDFVAINPGTVHVNDANNSQPSVLIPITIRGGAYQQPGGPAFKSFTVQLNYAVNNGSGNALTQTLIGMPNTVTTINLQQVFAPKISIAANQASASQGVYVNLTTYWPSNPAFSAAQYAQAGGDVYLNYSTSVGGSFFGSATVRIAAANFTASGSFLIPNVRIPSKPPSGMFTMTLVAVTSNAAIDPAANMGMVGYP